MWKLFLLVIQFLASNQIILSVDFGNRFSKAILNGHKFNTNILLTEESKRKETTGIFIKTLKSGNIERLYGNQIDSLCIKNPSNCFKNLKELMENKHEKIFINDYINQFHYYNITRDVNKNENIFFSIKNKEKYSRFNINELSGMFIKNIITRAQKNIDSISGKTKYPIDLFISVSSYATNAIRQSYIDTIKVIDGYRMYRLVDDLSAIILSYVNNQKYVVSNFNGVKKYFLIYDMGADSTKVTLFSITLNSNQTIFVSVEGISYKKKFGGQYFTDIISNLIKKKLIEKLNIREKFSPGMLEKIDSIAEKTKLTLSINSDYSIFLESFYDDNDFECTITRDEFEAVNSNISEEIMSPIYTVINEFGLLINEIDSLILHGGSTRVLLVQETLGKFFPTEKITKTLNLDEGCALGLSLYGLKEITNYFGNKNIVFNEKVYFDYNIRVNSGEMINVFKKYSEINTLSEYQAKEIKNKIDLELYEGNVLIKSYSFQNITSKIEKTNCDFNQTIDYFFIFSIDDNKLFDLVEFKAKCMVNLNNTITINNQNNTIDSTKTSYLEKIKSNLFNSSQQNEIKFLEKKVKITIDSDDLTYLFPESPSSSEINLSRHKINVLDKIDRNRYKLIDFKNNIEQKFYELRNFISLNEKEISKSLKADELNLINEYLKEKLDLFTNDFESINYRFANKTYMEVSKKFSYLKKLLIIQNTNLSYSNLQNIFSNFTSILSSVQEKILNHGFEINEINEKFKMHNFNFENENNRINSRLIRNKIKVDFLDNNSFYKNFTTNVTSYLTSNEVFNDFSKESIFDIYSLLNEKILILENDLKTLNESHNLRVKLLNLKFDKHMIRKKKEELRIENEANKIDNATIENDLNFMNISYTNDTVFNNTNTINLNSFNKNHDEL